MPASDLPQEPNIIKPSSLRSIMRNFAASVVVVTCINDDKLFGLTCNSFTSVSLKPELVSFCLNRSSSSSAAIFSSKKFVINVLSAKQQDMAMQFAKPSKQVEAGDKFTGVKYSLSAHGPILQEVNSYLECNLHSHQQAGDHDIIIGQISRSHHHEGQKSLLYWNREFKEF